MCRIPRLFRHGLALTLLFPILLSSVAKAALTIDVVQSGNNVVATATGTVNTAGLTLVPDGTISTPAGILAPALGRVALGSGGTSNIFSGFAGPSNFGSGSALGTASTGPIVGLSVSTGTLFLPPGYVSGSAIQSSSTFANQTVSSIGLRPGTYIWTWGSGGNADSLTLNIGSTLRYTTTGTITTFTPPATGTYTVLAYGAKGGDGSTTAGGTGARIAGDVAFTSGESISVLVAGRGRSASLGSGGGGSYVVRGAQTALIVAGGGGGGYVLATGNSHDASTGPEGQSSRFYFNGAIADAGGTAGGGGSGDASGGGLLGDGGSFGGKAFVNGGFGGRGTANGGFGGGGAVAGSVGGGGGGYSGGAGGIAGSTAGGGGSFNAGTNQSNTIAANPDGSGNGLVEITGNFAGLMPGKTYTLTYLVNNTADLLAALAAIDLTGSSSGPGLDYTIVFGTDITLTQQLWAINLDTGSSLTIEGNGRFLDGANTYNGFFVYNGRVAIKNLTIRNAKATGGDGGPAGISGGGGAGLGGGLFVASQGRAALSGVNFSGNSAAGGNGGAIVGLGYGGGGGLLGGRGGGSNNVSLGAAGGGGVGGNGGAPGQPGSAGLIPGAGSGGSGAEAAGGANAGGGGGGGTNGQFSSASAGGGGATTSGAGGFGGGGGGKGANANSGGFGGGGGGVAVSNVSGNGGFGGGAGGSPSHIGIGGFGAGAGGLGGGGGLGAGGNVFLQEGGTLSITGGTLGAGTLLASVGGSGSGGAPGSPGSTFGDGIFIQGNQSITLGAPTGQTLAVQGVIADQTGSGGTGGNAGAGAVLIDGGTGTVQFTRANTYTGGTTLNGGTFALASGGTAGMGAITFGAGQVATFSFPANVAPTNVVKGFSFGHTLALTGAGTATTATLGANNVLSITGGTVSPVVVNLDPTQSFAARKFNLASDGNGGTLVTLGIADFSRAVATADFDLFTATGLAPGSGVFTGTGVNGANGTFSPATAGLGQATITFTPTGGTAVTFTLTVTETPSLRVTTTSDTSTNTDGQTSLREALAYAMSGTFATTPEVTFDIPTSDPGYQAGTGAWTITLSGTELIIDRSVTITGPGADKLTLSGHPTIRSRIFTIHNRLQTLDVAITGLTLANAKGSTTDTNGGGGAIHSNFGGNFLLERCVFRDNGVDDGNARKQGGAIWHSDARLVLNQCSFTGNRATGADGQGGAVIAFGSQVEASSCVFTENQSGRIGGAIYLLFHRDGSVFEDCVFTDNRAESEIGAYGGALVVENSTSLNSLGLSRCVFERNVAKVLVAGYSNVAWGGAALIDAKNVTIRDCRIDSNEASGTHRTQGGGLFVGSGTNVSIHRTSVTRNKAQAGTSPSPVGSIGNGGGIYIRDGSVGLVNCTISENTAGSSITSQGGGIYSGGTLTLTNCTVAGNTIHNSTTASGTVSRGGGIYRGGGAVTLANTIIADNAASGGATTEGPDAWGAFTSSGNNLVGKSDGSSGFSSGGDQSGTVAAPLLAKLGPVGDHGGPVLSVPLLAGSPALDAGSNALAVDENNVALVTDQRGNSFARIVKGSRTAATATVDIGAFELFAAPEFNTDELTLSIAAAPLDLAAEAGVSPAGGVFSGPGVSGVFFDPRGLAPGQYIVTYTVTDAFGVKNAAALTVTVTSLPAKLEVERPKRFKPTEVGRKSAVQRLRITNTGGSPLTGLTVRMTGPHRKDFRLVKPGGAVIAPSGATVYRLTFKPRSPGVRKVTVTVSGGGQASTARVKGVGLESGPGFPVRDLNQFNNRD